MRVPSLVAALAIVAGCAPIRNYVYGPTPPTRRAGAAPLDGHSAAAYPVPAEDPRGEVQLAVERVTTLEQPEGRHKRKVRAVVVRMTVHNRDGEVWSVDSGALDAVVGGTQHQYPIRVYSDGQQVRVIVLEPGETRTVELYYEIPAKITKPSIAVEWRVNTPSGPVTRTTATLARREPPQPPDAQGR